jgi:hypothetical protein
MAYSDYGAFVWENGENITKQCCDCSFAYSNNENKFIKINNAEEYEIFEENKNIIVEGHAVLNFGDFCLEFYKVYEPKLVMKNGERKELSVLRKAEYTNKKLKLEIIGYPLDDAELINMFEIRYKDDCYCVTCGSQVGNGLESNHVSKYILKNMIYDKERGYHIFGKTDITIILDKLIRLDDIDFEKYLMKQYGIKPLIKNIFKFQFKELDYYIDEIQEHRERIKWLK